MDLNFFLYWLFFYKQCFYIFCQFFIGDLAGAASFYFSLPKFIFFIFHNPVLIRYISVTSLIFSSYFIIYIHCSLYISALNNKFILEQILPLTFIEYSYCLSPLYVYVGLNFHHQYHAIII